MIPTAELREQGAKPVRITAKGEIFFGDDEFPYPVVRDSVSVARHGRSRNLLTLTMFVGEVTMETKRPQGMSESVDDSTFVESSSFRLEQQ